MRINQSKRGKKNAKSKAVDKGARLSERDNETATVASVAIWNGERVSIENRELLEEIRQAEDSVETVTALSLGDFIKAGMDTLKNPLKEGPMARFIKKYRERIS